MRVASDTRVLEVDPGATSSVVVEVVNNGEVIDGVTARVIGIPDQCVTASPALLPLFPEASGSVTLALAVPPSHPAGRHPLTVEVVSHGTGQPSQFLDVDLDVSAKPAMRLVPRPKVVRARRSGRFILELVNEGNIPLEVELVALDVDRTTTTAFVPERLRVDPGVIAPVLLTLRGPRMLTGAEIDRQVSVEARARAVQVLVEAVPEPELTLTRTVMVQLRQRPIISRGLLTALILMSIVALWAAAFLLGIGKVFAADPQTKEAPASFFAATPSGSSGSGGSSGSSGSGGGSSGGSSAGGGSGAAPAGALPKTGEVPPGAGGVINGTVLAADDRQPVGRILIQAWRMARTGLVPVSSAATQADGTYSLAGLFPTSYYLQFSATGYTTVWYPNSPTAAGGQQVQAISQGTTQGVNATITGNPASFSGSVNPGDTLTPVVTTVTARPLLGSQIGQAVAVATTNAAGQYLLKGLPAPNSYELTFQTPGYQASTIVDTVTGGDKRLEPTITLGASTGQISGTVTNGVAALGGATVSTTVNGQPLTVITPTVGQVGSFVLGNLPTPATYVISFAAPGHGTTTTIVDLTAGGNRAGLSISLANGTGSVTGRVTGPGGQGLGGATVTVGGAAVAAGGGPPSTTTLTAGSVGSFVINGLTAPGAYTLTVTLAGYAPASVPITLTENGTAPNVTISMSTQLGSIAGTVTSGTPSGPPFPGATITATNDQQTWTATSNTADGKYLISNLLPGTYSVTATAPGTQQQTALVVVTAGQTSNQTLSLGS